MSNIFVKISKQLYPTGRAWWIRRNGVFHKLHEGLAESELEVKEHFDFLLVSVLPDNDGFTEEDATNWEQALGLFIQPYLTLAERKEIILRKMNHPGDIPARQHFLYVQGQLRKAGFDVYVHENRFGSPVQTYNPLQAIYGEVNYGQVNYGNTGIANYTTIANYVNEVKDSEYLPGTADGLKATFFIGGQAFPSFATVDINRKKEFRELILKLKPAQTVGFLLINYI